MKINKEIKLSTEDICKLYLEEKLFPGENVPGANCDYPDGWEDKVGIYTVEELLDLICYLNGKINLCDDANEMLGLKKENREEVLNELMKIYDESIRVLGEAIERSKMGYNDKSECIKRLHKTALEIEKNCDPQADFEKALEHERNNSELWGGRTVMDD